jgi:two-component system, NarL family, nitrate/nitrite response regulator NarL
MNQSGSLRVRVRAANPIRRQGLATMLEAAGHIVVEDSPDVTVCDAGQKAEETEAPAVVLTNGRPVSGAPAGLIPADATPAQVDAAVRAVAAGLLVRSSNRPVEPGFAVAGEDAPLLTPREREVLALVGQGLSNKAVARRLGISVHTVKFHLEALFAKLDATSRAEAVAKGLTGGVIEL